MADALILKTKQKPSFFNKDMLVGASVGLMLGPIPALAGAIIGGTFGYQRIERENRFGKSVGKPSFWNKDTLIGGVIGGEVGLLTGALGALAKVGVITAKLIFSSGTVAAAGLSTPAIMGVAALVAGGILIGAAAGIYIGGNNGEKTMAKEYAQAQAQQAAEVSTSVSRTQKVAQEPEMAQSLEFRNRLEQERAAQASLQQLR